MKHAADIIVGVAVPINELRLVLTVDDFDRATALFRDAHGLKQIAAWQNQSGHLVLLEAGHATLELIDEQQARAIDEIEVRRRVPAGSGLRLAAPIASRPPTRWRPPVRRFSPARRSRRGAIATCACRGPEGIQLTLFPPLGE